MVNELIITDVSLGAVLLEYVIISGLLVIWDRVLDHMEWKRRVLMKKGRGLLLICLPYFFLFFVILLRNFFIPDTSN